MGNSALIIGLGTVDCGDDAAGILVARRLAELGFNSIAHTASPIALIDIWKPSDSVIVIDAVLSGAQPGTVYVWNAYEQDFENSGLRSSTHAFGLADSIKLARALDRLPKSLVIYGIEAADVAAGTPPCAQVCHAVERVTHELVSRLRSPVVTKSSY